VASGFVLHAQIASIPTNTTEESKMPPSFEQAEESNRALWDEIAPVHFNAYREVDILRRGGIALDELEVQEVGEVKGKTLLHLQCHIGTDTLSWARLGAIVTGVDFSPQSLAYARQLQQELGLDATFIESNIYDLPQVLDGQFDIVYTSRGVLCWLRDIDAWARIIAHYLKPGGPFYIMESHPLLNVLEETAPGQLSIVHPYFHRSEPTLWDDQSGDYADESYIAQHPSYEWDWTLSDIVSALLKAGLNLESFGEHDRLFDRRFPGMMECAPGWFQMPEYAGKLPLIFTLRAKKPGG
jgi:SAM-dependent methyltransferase